MHLVARFSCEDHMGLGTVSYLIIRNKKLETLHSSTNNSQAIKLVLWDLNEKQILQATVVLRRLFITLYRKKIEYRPILLK